MKRLIIISDLWGGYNPTYVQAYQKRLEQQFDVKYYDACLLGEIDQTDFTKENLHQQFINGGIEIAVNNLLKAEPNKISILGFSIGGLIAWKAIQKGLPCDYLLSVSATRLRYETKALTCPNQLIYGDQDPFKPSDEWFVLMNIKYRIIKNSAQHIYKNEAIIDLITKELIKNRSC